jgi:hypothetical protein
MRDAGWNGLPASGQDMQAYALPGDRGPAERPRGVLDSPCAPKTWPPIRDETTRRSG